MKTGFRIENSAAKSSVVPDRLLTFRLRRIVGCGAPTPRKRAGVFA